MAVRTQRQLANRRRIECLIRLMAPALDLVLFTGDRIARVAGRNELAPEPARRASGPGAITASGSCPTDPGP